MNELYKRTLNVLGEAHLLILTNEELSELTKAITKYQRNKIKSVAKLETSDPTLLEDIASEVADVEIMTEQIKQAYNMGAKVQQYKATKLERLEGRVKTYEEKLRR